MYKKHKLDIVLLQEIKVKKEEIRRKFWKDLNMEYINVV